MKVTLIRFNRATQVAAVLSKSATPWSSASEVFHRKQFGFLTVLTAGWVSGARNRQRNFETIAQVEAYFRKLNTGGWLSDRDFEIATKMILSLGLID